MTEPPDKNSNNDQPAPAFWLRLVAENPEYKFKSGDSLWLFFNDGGYELKNAHLKHEDLPPCFDIEKDLLSEVTLLMRIRTRPYDYKKDPLALQTKWLYEIAERHNLLLIDTVLPRFRCTPDEE